MDPRKYRSYKFMHVHASVRVSVRTFVTEFFRNRFSDILDPNRDLETEKIIEADFPKKLLIAL